MKTISVLYHGTQTIEKLIGDGLLEQSAPYFIRIFTAVAAKPEASRIAAEIQSLFPSAQLLGASASGIIFQDQQYTDETMVLFDEYENVKISTGVFIWKGRKTEELAREVADFGEKNQAKMMHILCSDHYQDVHDFVDAFNRCHREILLVGGVVGDILSTNTPGYVFNAEGTIDNAIMVAALSGGNLYTYNEVNISHEPISEKYKLTGKSGCYWDSVNDQPAQLWLREQLGIEQPKDFENWNEVADNDEIVRFPMILEEHHGASRFLKYEAKTNRVSQYSSEIPVNTEFRIGYTSPAVCVQRSYEICAEIGNFPIESLFVYSCLFRRMYLNNCAEWELSPFKGYGVCGAFMMGEISHIDGTNEFLNGACCLVGTAENKVYIRPNSQVFVGMRQVKDDMQELLSFVLKKQRQAVGRKNEYLLEELLKHQKSAEKSVYYDVHVGLGNYIKYKEDRRLLGFDKLCMIQIENAESLKTHLGQDRYFKMLRKILALVRKFMEANGYDKYLPFYILNDETFFCAAVSEVGETDFLRMIKALFERFQFAQLGGSKEIFISRYVVVLHQKDLVESALNTLHANKQLQSAFLICNKAGAGQLSSDEEFKVIGVLNRALENEGVVPYFQGIYDNSTGKIEKYEALMRIEDVDGMVYGPQFFMGTAKKYHLYSYLSARMFKKVFTLFRNRAESVTLNFSAYDINSEEMQKLIFDNLDAIEDASNFVLEIVEDEQFRDIHTLQDFVLRARGYNVKIAIDDFGSGYSNFMEMVQLKPDYIKVDGEIIRNVHISDINRKLLKTIIFMGEQFGIHLVAEFVENEEIQDYVSKCGVQYSQGYYFARPVRFEELHLG